MGCLGVRGLLLGGVRRGTLLPVVARLALVAIGARTVGAVRAVRAMGPMLPVACHLLAVLHGAHAPWRAALHAQRVPLCPWRAVALAGVGVALWRAGRALALRVGVGPAVWWSDLTHLVHRAWRLVPA